MRHFGSTLTFILAGGGGRLRFAILCFALVQFMDLTCFADPTRKGQSRCNSYPGHHIIRQDTVNVVSKQGSIPCLYNDWKYSKGDPPQTIPPCPGTPRLSSRNTARAHPEQEQPPPVSHELVSRLHAQGSQAIGVCRCLRHRNGEW